MKLSVRVTGPAGLGVNSLAHIIGSITAKLGYFVLSDLEYESRIKGGVNYFDFHISDQGEYLSKNVDIILAFDKNSLLQQIPFLKSQGVVIANTRVLKMCKKDLETREDIQTIALESREKFDNVGLLALFGKLTQLDINLITEELEDVFAKK
ncbi:MAG: 2-oxoacid:acceptor oxidoreductase family protein [Patescibacteria group bacterium]|nr:2-oxoacid:acceptor oxidoreductase family protein [Patescibacteria group bacterium]